MDIVKTYSQPSLHSLAVSQLGFPCIVVHNLLLTSPNEKRRILLELSYKLKINDINADTVYDSILIAIENWNKAYEVFMEFSDKFSGASISLYMSDGTLFR